MLDKPLKPIFITPESSLEIMISEEYYPVLLATASEVVPGGYKRSEGFVYVQGAADDEESWSYGLNSVQFWSHAQELLRCTREDELVRCICQTVRKEGPKELEPDYSVIGFTGISLGIGSFGHGNATIVCGKLNETKEDTMYVDISSKSKLVVALTRKIFPSIVSFALAKGILNHSPLSILAVDNSRETLDLSISISLVLLTLFFDDNGISDPS
jgi:hypothetical protein